MCKFSTKSGGVPFQISFFLGDLTRSDPICIYNLKSYWCLTNELLFLTNKILIKFWLTSLKGPSEKRDALCPTPTCVVF